MKQSIKLGVLFLKRKRAGFMPEWGELIEEKVKKQFTILGLNSFIPDTKIVDIESLNLAFDECNAKHCNVFIAVQSTMSDGRLAPVLGQRANTPVIFWATTEKQDTDMISACTLVGAHTFCATLAQLGYPFELVDGFPEDESTNFNLTRAIYRSFAYGEIKNSQSALIGYHAPGFIDMHVDPFSLKDCFGIDLHHIGLHEFIDEVNAVSEIEAKNDCDKFLSKNIKLADNLTAKDLLVSSRYYIALKNRFNSMKLKSMGIREWPELSGSMGWPYLALSRLVTEGYAIGCEGDTDGALTCLIAESAGCGEAYMSDWLENDDHHITLWHGGAAPMGLCSEKMQVALHFNGKNPVVLESTLQQNIDITMIRLWHLRGQYYFTAVEGRTIEPKRHLKGTNGLGFFPNININDYLQKLLHKGMPHHPVIIAGHHRKHLYKLMKNLNVECID